MGGEKVGQSEQGREVGTLGVIWGPIGWGCNGLRLIPTMRPAHWLTPQLNGWQQQTAPTPTPSSTQSGSGGKIKRFFFFYPLWGLQCQEKGRRNTNSQAVSDVPQYKIIQKLHVRRSQAEKNIRGWSWEGGTEWEKRDGDQLGKEKEGRSRQMGFEMFIWWVSFLSSTGRANKNVCVCVIVCVWDLAEGSKSVEEEVVVVLLSCRGGWGVWWWCCGVSSHR